MTYSITGTIIDGQSQNPIKGAKISISPTFNFVYSDAQGNFTITGSIPENENLLIDIRFIGYQPIQPSLYKGDNTLKTNLGIIQLQSTISSLTQEKIQSTQLSKEQIKEISKNKKDLSYYAEEKLSNQINILKNTLTPSILTMIAKFGVTQISNVKPEQFIKYLDQADCPTQTELTSLINQKNKLVKQLSNTLKLINSTTKALGVTEGILAILDITLFTADNTPTNINPFTPGLNKTLSKTIDKLKSVNAGTLSILILLRQVLLQVLQLLNLLDQLTQKCYPSTAQEQLSIELITLTLQQTQQLSPIVINVNGFEMGVETEPTTNSLKRRRAIARNSQGVVMLKGEWSFSSIDQILIDELVFYIQQNDLKAE